MSRPLSTTEVLEAILKAAGMPIEAEPKWFPHDEEGNGEAQAVIATNEHRYAISLESLP